MYIVDTSIKHPISGQSTTMVIGCMYIKFDMVDTAFSHGKSTYWLLISSGIIKGKRKYFAWNLKCRDCVFTRWGRLLLLTITRIITNSPSSMRSTHRVDQFAFWHASVNHCERTITFEILKIKERLQYTQR